MKAGQTGICGACGKQISVGDEITSRRKSFGGAWCHARCLTWTNRERAAGWEVRYTFEGRPGVARYVQRGTAESTAAAYRAKAHWGYADVEVVAL